MIIHWWMLEAAMQRDHQEDENCHCVADWLRLTHISGLKSKQQFYPLLPSSGLWVASICAIEFVLLRAPTSWCELLAVAASSCLMPCCSNLIPFGHDTHFSCAVVWFCCTVQRRWLITSYFTRTEGFGIITRFWPATEVGGVWWLLYSRYRVTIAWMLGGPGIGSSKKRSKLIYACLYLYSFF